MLILYQIQPFIKGLFNLLNLLKFTFFELQNPVLKVFFNITLKINTRWIIKKDDTNFYTPADLPRDDPLENSLGILS